MIICLLVPICAGPLGVGLDLLHEKRIRREVGVGEVELHLRQDLVALLGGQLLGVSGRSASEKQRLLETRFSLDRFKG